MKVEILSPDGVPFGYYSAKPMTEVEIVLGEVAKQYGLMIIKDVGVDPIYHIMGGLDAQAYLMDQGQRRRYRN